MVYKPYGVNEVALGACIAAYGWATYADGSQEETEPAEKNSPGRRNVVPYTSSAALHLRSSLRVDLMLRRTNGSKSTQRAGFWCTLREVFNCRWKRSTRLIAAG